MGRLHNKWTDQSTKVHLLYGDEWEISMYRHIGLDVKEDSWVDKDLQAEEDSPPITYREYLQENIWFDNTPQRLQRTVLTREIAHTSSAAQHNRT